jgi:hypothetical protein
MTAASATPRGTAADLDAARLLLARMGLSAQDLLASPERPSVPTFAEYIPIVAAAVGDGTRRVYGSYWTRILDHWGNRHLNEPTPSEIKQLVELVKLTDLHRVRLHPTRPRRPDTCRPVYRRFVKIVRTHAAAASSTPARSDHCAR